MEGEKKIFQNYPINKHGLLRFSKANRYRLCGIWKLKKTAAKKRATKPKRKRRLSEPDHKYVEKKFGSGTRMVRVPKLPKDYPLIVRPKPKKKGPAQPAPPLKKSLSTPGTVCIVLLGPLAGKRVIFLKQLPRSGHIVVTGPRKINGVPLRRIYPCHVIATSMKIKIPNLEIPESVNDDFFKIEREKPKHAKDDDGNIFQEKPRRKGRRRRVWTDERREVQNKVDDQIISAIRTHHGPMMVKYLRSKFAITGSVRPHVMKF